jgi:NADH-quinone oxidoreductase subunit J
MEAVVFTSLGLMFIFGIMSVMLHSLIKSAVALAAGSVALGVIMYELGFAWAALFEISVCSGLVTVIIISAVSLSNAEKKEIEKQYEDKARMKYLPALLIISGVVLVVVALATGVTLTTAIPVEPKPDNFREILWTQRQADIWGQIIVIITGATAVVVLFREQD